MFCKNCGTQIDDNAIVCEKCGTPTGVTQSHVNQRQVSFVEAIKRFFTKENFSTDGRASRSEFWWTYLFLCLVNAAFFAVFGEKSGNSACRLSNLLIIFIAVRRLHDVGRSGWFLLIPIYNVVLLCFPGENTTNKFGPVPNSLDTND